MTQALIKQLRETLPFVPFIRVWENSPQKYKYTGVDELHWNRFNPSLSRVWNWAILQSQTEWVLVASDDIRLKPTWYVDLARENAANPESLWHGPSRFFLFNKKLLDKVGMFDERLTGNTYEDLDYVRRLNFYKVPKVYGRDSSLIGNAESLKGEIDRPLLTCKNAEFIFEKYSGNRATENFDVDPILPTPDFYPMRTK
jgi:hypothetical protein